MGTRRSGSRHTVLIASALAALGLLVGGTGSALAAPPLVEVDPASNITFTTADVSGEVDPVDRNAASCRFDYISQSEHEFWESIFGDGFVFAAAVPCDVELAELTAGSGPKSVASELTGLQPGTAYRFRVVLENVDGERAEDLAPAFESAKPAPPTVTVADATDITDSSAHLTGTVELAGADPAFDTTACSFDYITQAAYEAAGNSFEGAPSVACQPETVHGSDPQPVAVEADLNLEPNTAYRIQLRASNGGGTDSDEAPSFQTDAVPPTFGPLVHSQLGQGRVAIGAYVNPRNSAITDCEFSYGPTESYGSTVPCEALPSTDNKPHLIRAELPGLDLGSTYHFMAAVDGDGGPANSDDDTFITLAAPSSNSDCLNANRPGVGFLPDCRAWEMVSPQDKNGGDIPAVSFRTRVATDGSAAQFMSLSGFGGVEGMGVSADYLSRRSDDPNPGDQGWRTHPITPSQESMYNLTFHLVGAEPKYLGGAFSDDLSHGVFLALSPLSSAPNVADIFNFYSRDDLLEPGPGDYQLLTDCPPPSEGGPCEAPFPQTLAFSALPWAPSPSADFSRVAFESKLKLTLDASPVGRAKAYESVSGSPPRLLGILPDGSASPSSRLGSGEEGGYALHRPVSTDGSRAIFTAGNSLSVPARGAIFARIDGRATVQLNASERATLDSPAPARYWAASSDATRAFFTSEEALTDDAPVGDTKLYMWARETHNERQSVSVGATGGAFALSFNGRSTESVPYDAPASAVEDALEGLAGPPPLGHPLIAAQNVTVTGGPGGLSPYVIEFTGDFAGSNVSQLEGDPSDLTGGAATVLVQTDQAVHNLTYLSADGESADGNVAPVAGVIGASGDGRRVFFVATGQLVPGAPLGLGTTIYLWEDGQLRHLSNFPDFFANRAENLNGFTSVNGAPPQSYVTPAGDLIFSQRDGQGILSTQGGTDYDHASCGETSAGCLQLYLYDADRASLQCASCNPSGIPPVDAARNRIMRGPQIGGAVVSNSLSRALSFDGRYAYFSTATPLAPNDINGASDAYIYDSATGRPSLISSGENPQPSFFLEASATGRDVFFTTAERLSAWDTDRNYDLYDARVGGGFPEPVPPPASCQGDACQPPPAALNDATPSSSAFVGPGDSQSKRKPTSRCLKGKRKIRRNGSTRCIRHGSRRSANTDQRNSR